MSNSIKIKIDSSAVQRLLYTGNADGGMYFVTRAGTLARAIVHSRAGGLQSLSGKVVEARIAATTGMQGLVSEHEVGLEFLKISVVRTLFASRPDITLSEALANAPLRRR